MLGIEESIGKQRTFGDDKGKGFMRLCADNNGKIPGAVYGHEPDAKTCSTAIHRDKGALREYLRPTRKLCEGKLKPEPNEKTYIFPMRNGVDSLGWHFYVTEGGKVANTPRTRNKRKLKRRMKGLQKDRIYIFTCEVQ